LAVQRKLDSIGNSREQKIRGLDGLKRDKGGTAREVFALVRETNLVQHMGGNLNGQPGLADATRSDKRQQSAIRIGQDVGDLGYFLHAADERRGLWGEVVRSNHVFQ